MFKSNHKVKCIVFIFTAVGSILIVDAGFNLLSAADRAAADSFVANSTPIAIAFMINILVLKITAFILGYLIVRLGHDTLIKGISGEIDFGFTGSGVSAKLKSGSPGALFVLMGAAIILWGLTVQKPMELKMVPPSDPAPVVKELNSGAPLHRAPLSD